MSGSNRRRRSKAGFGGAWCIPELFAHAFEEAVHALSGGEIAELLALGVGPVGALGWLEVDQLTALEAFVANLRHRALPQRYRVDRGAHSRLRQLVGDDLSSRPRALFVLAKIIDDLFDELAEDVAHLPADMLKRATARPPNFFQDVVNRPPAIGQMTPIAICRGAFQRFWYTGNVASARMFGPMPAPVRVRLPERTAAALRTAADTDELRLAAVCWPPNAARVPDRSRSGRFVVTSHDRPATRADLEGIVSFAGEARAHVLLLPELALGLDELRELKDVLATRDARFPALTVAGLTHHRPSDHTVHVNEAVVLTSRGAELFRHEKLEPFSLDDRRFEDIVPRRSSSYHYLDTPIGRLTVNVCRDFRSDVPMILNRALGAAGVLVPALSKKLDFVLEEARLLGSRQDAFVLAANPWSEVHAACIYVPIRGGRDKSGLPAPQTYPAPYEGLPIASRSPPARSPTPAAPQLCLRIRRESCKVWHT